MPINYASNMFVLLVVLFIYLVSVGQVNPINGTLFMLASNATIYVMAHCHAVNKGKANQC